MPMIPRYTLPEMGRLWSDESRFTAWLEVEIAAAQAMEDEGEIPAGTAAALRKNARFDAKRIERIEAEVHHDVIAFLTNVSENLGEERAYLHRGMTSSDLLDSAQALLLVKACDLITARLTRIGRLLRELSGAHRGTPMIGRTHGVHAEPITFGMKVLIWFAEMERHATRLAHAREEVRTGKLSGAVGTFAHLSPAIEARACEILGLRAAPVSNQIVQRDRHAHLLAVLALVGATCEKIAIEIRHLQRTEVAEVFEPFARGQKGSSAMPHKRNPILCERISGMARLLRGQLAPAYENIALWHERDISHSSVERVILPDAFIGLDYTLHLTERVLAGLEVDGERMRANMEAGGGLFYSQRALLALTAKLGSREDAYAMVQRAAMAARQQRRSLRELLEEDAEVRSQLSAAELGEIFDLEGFFTKLEDVFARVLATDWAS
jgi:adenylosuccinate lyase